MIDEQRLEQERELSREAKKKGFFKSFAKSEEYKDVKEKAEFIKEVGKGSGIGNTIKGYFSKAKAASKEMAKELFVKGVAKTGLVSEEAIEKAMQKLEGQKQTRKFEEGLGHMTAKEQGIRAVGDAVAAVEKVSDWTSKHYGEIKENVGKKFDETKEKASDKFDKAKSRFEARKEKVARKIANGKMKATTAASKLKMSALGKVDKVTTLASAALFTIQSWNANRTMNKNNAKIEAKEKELQSERERYDETIEKCLELEETIKNAKESPDFDKNAGKIMASEKELMKLREEVADSTREITQLVIDMEFLKNQSDVASLFIQKKQERISEKLAKIVENVF